MASARPVSTTRRSRGTGSGKGDQPEISSARWGGVALVIAALMGAIVLAVISPGDQLSTGRPGVVAAPATTDPGIEATPVPADTRLPTEVPTITTPTDTITAEWEFDMTVQVPKDALPRRLLDLVVLRAGEIIGERSEPKVGAKETVSIRLDEGENVVTAALRGPGGLGPRSEPVSVTLDRDAPVLTITSPKHKEVTFDDSATVSGTSEPGAKIVVTNKARGFESPMTVGPSGTYNVVVPLRMGGNPIVVRSTDAAGMKQRKAINVKRKDGRPVIEVTTPKRIRRPELPKDIRVVVEVTDVDGNRMEGATVSYTLGGPGRTTETFVDQTNAKGRSAWVVEVTAGSSQPVQLTLEVTAPTGYSRTASRQISIS